MCTFSSKLSIIFSRSFENGPRISLFHFDFFFSQLSSVLKGRVYELSLSLDIASELSLSLDIA